MHGPFDDLDRLDLDAHTRRWSSPDAGRADGAVSQRMAAGQQFAARVQEDPAAVSDERSLFDAASVLDRSLDALPMSPAEATTLAPRWRGRLPTVG